MLYKIEISELIENPESNNYPKERKVYEQIIEDLSVDKVVLFVNDRDDLCSQEQEIEIAKEEIEEIKKSILNK